MYRHLCRCAAGGEDAVDVQFPPIGRPDRPRCPTRPQDPQSQSLGAFGKSADFIDRLARHGYQSRFAGAYAAQHVWSVYQDDLGAQRGDQLQPPPGPTRGIDRTGIRPVSVTNWCVDVEGRNCRPIIQPVLVLPDRRTPAEKASAASSHTWQRSTHGSVRRRDPSRRSLAAESSSSSNRYVSENVGRTCQAK